MTDHLEHLPVAGRAQVRRAVGRLVRADRRAFAVVILLNLLAAGAGLAAPWLLGRIIDEVRAGASVGTVDRLALGIVVAALAQLLLTRYARLVGHRFGERTSARIREGFVDRVLALPVPTVERAGTGDLTARGSADVERVGITLRDAGPDVLVAVLQAVALFVAIFLLDPVLGACALVGLVGIGAAYRWYLRRARAAYLAEGAAASALAEVTATTAAGARTIELLRLGERRIAASDAAIERSRAARLRTLFLRSVLFPAVDVSSVVPLVGVLLVGGALLDRGAMTLGAVVAAALYVQQLSRPLDTLMLWVEQIQAGAAAFARVEGLAEVTPARRAGAVPGDERVVVRGVHHGYGDGPDVLHGIDLELTPGERLAVVGTSGAGKTTLSRLLAGVERPRRGQVTVGGVPVADVAPDELRRHVVMVSQEHHVFLGTLRENLQVAAPDAPDERLLAALHDVGASWADELPGGLGSVVDGLLDGPQAQQLALARVVLADPHTVVLDEATALLDPRTARRTERALAAVLVGRTVVAVAHRLHTAEDADRVALMSGGRLVELGPHADLLAADGAYAALWRSWQGEV